jgi:hypothetical protein
MPMTDFDEVSALLPWVTQRGISVSTIVNSRS